MTKVSQNHLSAVNGGANCFLIGVATGLAALGGSVIGVIGGLYNAYTNGCL